MEMASEKCMIATTNLKLGVKYDYSGSGCSHPSSLPGGDQRIPTYALLYQNLRITQGLQVSILVKIQDKIPAALPGLEFHFQISVSASFQKMEGYLSIHILLKYLEYPEYHRLRKPQFSLL